MMLAPLLCNVVIPIVLILPTIQKTAKFVVMPVPLVKDVVVALASTSKQIKIIVALAVENVPQLKVVVMANVSMFKQITIIAQLVVINAEIHKSVVLVSVPLAKQLLNAMSVHIAILGHAPLAVQALKIVAGSAYSRELAISIPPQLLLIPHQISILEALTKNNSPLVVSPIQPKDTTISTS